MRDMCQKRDDLDKQILQYSSELSKGLVKLDKHCCGNIVSCYVSLGG